MDSKKYMMRQFIDIRFGDPISALRMSDKFVVVGTMMGRIAISSLTDNELIRPVNIADLNAENINDISIQDDNQTFNVAIGDEAVEKYHIKLEKNIPAWTMEKKLMYDNETDHMRRCENAYVILSPDSVLNIGLSQHEENNVTISEIKAPYTIRFLTNNKKKKDIYEQKLKMTNYSIPFDFDGENFCYVQFLSSEEREICIVNLIKEPENIKKFSIKKDFGHISHIKLMQDKKIFIVRKLNICEIRNIDEGLTIVKSFKHIGDEVYAVDIHYDIKNETTVKDEDIKKSNNTPIDRLKNRNKNYEVFNLNLVKVHDTGSKDVGEKLCLKETPIEIKGSSSGAHALGTVNFTYVDYIVTLDIDGNVNAYFDDKERTLFNMYDIDNIDKDLKEKKFFSMGYAYYIRTNLKHFCVSSDHGCFVIEGFDKNKVFIRDNKTE